MFVHELILNLEYDFEIIFEEKTKEFKKKMARINFVLQVSSANNCYLTKHLQVITEIHSSYVNNSSVRALIS